MAICPFASVRLLDPAYVGRTPLYAHNRVNLHVQAGTGSLFGFFNAPGRASSHFWVAYSGLIEQYQDTAYTAEADLQGSDATISIETEGGTGPNADTDPWTPAQVEALVRLVQWIMDTHGIRKVLVSSSHPDDRSKGQSWHRVGIDGNFPALPDIRAGRLQRGGGMLYSKSRGKVCPGGGKIQQIPDILARVNGGGGTVPVPPDPGGGTPPPSGGLTVDGSWGPATTRRLQEYLGTAVDGVLSHQYRQDGINYPGLYSAQWDGTLIGSNCIRALQRKIGAVDDGLCGRDTILALQRHLGTAQDGVISTPYSNMVAELQRRLNANNL
jgi:hypothetical protein